MKNRQLLVISNGFPEISTKRYHCQFVYEQTALASKMFSNINVISPQPYMPPVLQPMKILAPYTKLSGFHDYVVNNMEIYYPEFFTLPIASFRDKNSFLMTKVIEQAMVKINVKPDVIHVHFLHPSGESMIPLLPSDIPKILSMHGSDAYSWAKINLDRARRVWRAFDRLHVPSHYLARALKQLDLELNPESIFVIPPSYDKNIFYPKINKTKTREVLMVANLIQTKGHMDALKAFVEIVKSYPEAKLRIVGAGPLQSQIQNTINELKLRKSVEMIGPVGHKDLTKYYQRAELLLFPSYRESFGIVQVEAMACGTPVVAYDNEGSREIFAKHPQWLVKTGDISGLTKMLKQVFESNPDMRELLDIIKPYEQDKVKKQLEQLYRF